MQILLGTLVYLIVTFPLAFFWHMKIFRAKYMAWGYFGEDAKIIFGFLSMVLQGIVLSYGYLVLTLEHSSMTVGIEYALVMGLFLWSTHVLATIAKNSKLRHFEFVTMETIYLVIQFAVYGILISFIF